MKFYVFLIALFGLVFAEEQVKSIPLAEIVLRCEECLIPNPAARKYFVEILDYKYPDVPEVDSHMDCVADKLGLWDLKTGQFNVERLAEFFSVDPNNAEDMDIIQNCVVKPEEEEIHVRRGYLCILNSRLGDNVLRE